MPVCVIIKLYDNNDSKNNKFKMYSATKVILPASFTVVV